MNERDEGPRAGKARGPRRILPLRRLPGAQRSRRSLPSRSLPLALLALATALATAAPEAVAARDGRLGRSSAATAKIVLVVPERRALRQVSIQPACIEPDKARAFRSYYGDGRASRRGSTTDTAGCVADPTATPTARGPSSAGLLMLEPE